jgi:hypothetical protein
MCFRIESCIHRAIVSASLQAIAVTDVKGYVEDAEAATHINIVAVIRVRCVGIGPRRF